MSTTKLSVGDQVTIFGRRGWEEGDHPLRTTTVKRILKYKTEFEDGTISKLKEGTTYDYSSYVRLTTPEHLQEMERYTLFRWLCDHLTEGCLKKLSLEELKTLEAPLQKMKKVAK